VLKPFDAAKVCAQVERMLKTHQAQDVIGHT